MNKEAKNNKKENILLTMLRLLEKLDVKDATLYRKYSLNRVNLGKIRKGQNLLSAHGKYFRALISELELQRNIKKNALDGALQNHIRNVMFECMLREFGVL